MLHLTTSVRLSVTGSIPTMDVTTEEGGASPSPEHPPPEEDEESLREESLREPYRRRDNAQAQEHPQPEEDEEALRGAYRRRDNAQPRLFHMKGVLDREEVRETDPELPKH